ncbi:MAG TPA: hypothetical protein VKP61_15015 [Candidatus Acidoferrum sp.]|nr:hypothetical protein [Candidatus Acidoferrum sp.]
MSEFIVEKCDRCGHELRRTPPAGGAIVLVDTRVSEWMKIQLGNGEVKSLCPPCTAPVRELLKPMFPLLLPDLPDSDADRGPIQ